MPIRIPDALPATSILEGENIFVMTEHRAMHQDIRPLRVLLLNLMPTKIVTETQIMRKLSNTPLQIEVDLLRIASHKSKNDSADHLETFYRTFDQVRDLRYDGMIITGAPVETLDFESVDYWPELVEIMDWSLTNVHSVLHVCWGAQAALYHHYGVPKHNLSEKCFGVFENRLIKPSSPLVRGFNDVSMMPHSRNSETRYEDIVANQKLEVISYSDECGVSIAKSTDSKHFFVFGLPQNMIAIPSSLNTIATLPRASISRFRRTTTPTTTSSQDPIVSWRAEGQLIYTNWLNYYVYQTTPYDLGTL